MSLDAALPTFIAESADLLREFEDGLLKYSDGGTDPEIIHLIFRSAHTIKGSAGLFGLGDIVAFMHVVENVLDRVRQGAMPLSRDLVTRLLASKDHTESLIARVVAGHQQPDAALEARGAELLAGLRGLLPAAPGKDPAADGERSGPGPAPARAATWGISVRFGPEVLQAGMDPLGFIRYLQTFGELRAVTVQDDALPAPDEMQPETCYLGFDLEFSTDADRERIEGAFEFVREDCTLTLRPPAPPVPAQSAPSEPPPAAPAASAPSGPPAMPARAPGGLDAAQMVRVDAHKLDSLVTRIGELITVAARANLLARHSGGADLQDCTVTLAELVEQVRDSALQLRMVKIGATFNRFQRLVRDVSQELGKEIHLVIHGEDTELDKTVVEQISDPLTHLVRNAMDHGIEPAEARLAAGKPAAGTVTLSARHDSGSIVIDISDDGGGLKRDRILAKALERGLAEPGRALSDREIFNFIFEPGFSTAAAITNLSGRGVGMDVVKRNITALRGSIQLDSEPGAGTSISVRLPLTLAIIQGFQIAVGRSTFVLPLDSIDECIEFSAPGHHDLTDLRGDPLPVIRLRDLLQVTGPASHKPSIVVVRHGDQRAGLVVDCLLGECQTVIKPLGSLFRRADFASGSSILGSGEVALILDVPALIRRAMRGRPGAAPSTNLLPLSA